MSAYTKPTLPLFDAKVLKRVAVMRVSREMLNSMEASVAEDFETGHVVYTLIHRVLAREDERRVDVGDSVYFPSSRRGQLLALALGFTIPTDELPSFGGWRGWFARRIGWRRWSRRIVYKVCPHLEAPAGDRSHVRFLASASGDTYDLTGPI